MFDENVKLIQNLSNIEMVIHEINSVIFTRKNKKYIDETLNFVEKVIDDLYGKYNIDLSSVSNDKKIILIRYEKLLRNFIEEIESLFANIIEQIEIAESNQCVLFLEKETLNSINEIYQNSSLEEKQRVISEASNLNINLENIDSKLYQIIEKNQKYEEILSFCEYELKVCEKTVENEIKKFYIQDIDFKSKTKAITKSERNRKIAIEIANYFENYLNNFEKNIANKLIISINLYTINFKQKIENIQKKSINN